MAVPPYPYVHLETVEAAKDAKEETACTGTARMDSLRRGIQQEGLLAYGEYGCGQKSPDKRKTDTMEVLRPIQCIPVSARQLLKPPCTERYARWCERTGVNHPLLLDFLYVFYVLMCFSVFSCVF